jgi:hypothetical protein
VVPVDRHVTARRSRRPLSDAAAQTFDGDEDGGLFKHLHQPVEKHFVVVMSRLKIFFKNALGFTDGLNCQSLIAHARTPRN